MYDTPARPTARPPGFSLKPGKKTQENTTIYLDESLNESRRNESELQQNKLLDYTSITRLSNNMREIKKIAMLKFVL